MQIIFEGFESIRNYLVTQKNKMGWNTEKIIEITGKTSASHYFSKSQWGFPTREHYEAIREATKGDAFKKEYDALKKEYDTLKKEYDTLKKEYYATRAYFNNTHDNMNNVWHFSRHQKDGTEGGHATPKPIPLCERAIKSSCPDSGLVLDFFLGSGSTMVASHQLAAVQSEFTCAAGIFGLFKICDTPLAAVQSEFTCAAGIVGLFII